MKAADYGKILDAFQTTGVYVIREDNHQIQYFNKRVQQVAPDIKKGMVCHELWKKSCINCPLRHIGDRERAQSISYDNPFGKSVKITATRLLWEDEIPAFVVTLVPYVETANYVYHEVMRGDLLSDSYEIIKADETEVQEMRGYADSLSGWFRAVAEKGYIYEDDRGRYEKFVQFSRLKEGLKKKDHTLNCIYRRKSGSQFRWHTLEIVPDIDYSEDNQRIMIYLKDIHDVFRDGLEREEMNNRNQEIIHSLGEENFAVYVVDLVNGGVNVVQVTEQVQENVKRDNFLWGRIFEEKEFDKISLEDQDEFRRKFSLEAMQEAWFEGKKKREFVCRVLLRGGWRYVSITAYFKGNRKQESYAILAFRDVDERTKSERIRVENDKRMVAVINSLSSMFFATYYIDLEEETYRTVIQKADIGGSLGPARDYTEGIGRYARHYVSSEDQEEYLKQTSIQNMRSLLNREYPFHAFEYRVQPDENNRRVWIRATMVLSECGSDGKPQKVLYVVQDVTETRKREEREQQALREACEAANHANAAKSEFMSRMSHDIRTPMNAIIGMTAIAGRYLDDKDRVADCLGKITVSSKHLLSLINEVLDMSKIESGTIDLAEEKIDLSDLIENLITMIQSTIQKKDQKLDVRIVNLEHEQVISDSTRLQQIFMNILGNAVKYTGTGGHIEVEIHEKPSVTYGYGCYEFIFRDNGIGMSQEFLEKLFEPFSRASDSRISKIEGTGLGTTIARNIARRMNGDITVESEVGKGTQFTVMLSLKLQDETAQNTEKLVNLPVLVVDDDEVACESTCLILENIGMKGEYVLCGQEAVERVWERHQRKEDYFAVILDWKMPEMDGVETARQIRRRVGPDVPIIILSAYDWSTIEEEARLAGVDVFISKPLFKSRLLYLFNQIAGYEDEQGQGNKEQDDRTSLWDKRILLVEDNELNREIAEELISDTGASVESAENGQEAVERFQEAEEGYYDMIFMDIQMPVMNGYEATAAIRSLPRRDAANIPIIAMTANAFPEDIRQSQKAGMNAHLTKPLDIGHLMKCLKTWLG